jgi:serine/threonine protein phosphatase 1
MKTLRVSFQDENFIYVHAGLEPTINMEYQLEHDMLWIRNEFLTSDKDFDKQVVFGHTPTKGNPLILPNKIGLDTGCVYGNKLTCMRMDNSKIWQVEGYNG